MHAPGRCLSACGVLQLFNAQARDQPLPYLPPACRYLDQLRAPGGVCREVWEEMRALSGEAVRCSAGMCASAGCGRLGNCSPGCRSPLALMPASACTELRFHYRDKQSPYATASSLANSMQVR